MAFIKEDQVIRLTLFDVNEFSTCSSTDRGEDKNISWTDMNTTRRN